MRRYAYSNAFPLLAVAGMISGKAEKGCQETFPFQERTGTVMRFFPHRGAGCLGVRSQQLPPFLLFSFPDEPRPKAVAAAIAFLVLAHIPV
jgi:hypothetical protein